MSYMVNCVARYVVYVSAVLANNIPVGSDSLGDGSPAAPYLTIAKAIPAVPTGGRILLNGDPASPTAYAVSASFTTTVDIGAVVALGAVLIGSGATEAVTIAPTVAGKTFTFSDLIIDPSLNSGGAAARCVTFTSAGGAFPDVTFTRCLLENWTTYALTSDATVRLGTLTFTDCIFSSGLVYGGVYLSSIATGHLVVTNGSLAITCLVTTGVQAAFLWNANTAGVTASFTNFSQTIKFHSLSTSGLLFGIRVINVENALVDGGTHVVNGHYGAQGCPVSLETNATATPAHGATIRGITATNNVDGGYCARIGVETAGSFLPIVGGIIEDCILTADTASEAADCHGAFMGVTTDSFNRRNTITHCGFNGFKESTNGTFDSNVINGFITSGMAMKGCTGGTMSNNTVNQIDALSGNCLTIEQNVDTGNPSTDIIVTGNSYVVAGGSSSVFVNVDSVSSFTPTLNDYRLSSGTLATNKFVAGGANYTTLAAWQAIEPTATGNIP